MKFQLHFEQQGANHTCLPDPFNVFYVYVKAKTLEVWLTNFPPRPIPTQAQVNERPKEIRNLSTSDKLDVVSGTLSGGRMLNAHGMRPPPPGKDRAKEGVDCWKFGTNDLVRSMLLWDPDTTDSKIKPIPDQTDPSKSSGWGGGLSETEVSITRAWA